MKQNYKASKNRLATQQPKKEPTEIRIKPQFKLLAIFLIAALMILATAYVLLPSRLPSIPIGLSFSTDKKTDVEWFKTRISNLSSIKSDLDKINFEQNDILRIYGKNRKVWNQEATNRFESSERRRTSLVADYNKLAAEYNSKAEESNLTDKELPRQIFDIR